MENLYTFYNKVLEYMILLNLYEIDRLLLYIIVASK